jgi:16S rRNA (cytosine1402-N4)-methyltransferase
MSIFSQYKDHIPVLLREVIESFAGKSGVILDATFGAGGHSRLILENTTANIVALDRDENAKQYADILAKDYPNRLTFINTTFLDYAETSTQMLDGILADFGVSSMQLDQGERGFSFSKEAELDMRMGLSSLSASDVVNSYDESELGDILYRYGGERKSRKIATAIVAARPVATTTQLAEIIKTAAGFYNDKIHPATRSFQAIRIEVNEELKQIESALPLLASKLNPQGVFAAISFHSGEDAIVKDAFNKLCGKDKTFSRHTPDFMLPNKTAAGFSPLGKQPITPKDDELKANPRSRSSKMRVVIKN